MFTVTCFGLKHLLEDYYEYIIMNNNTKMAVIKEMNEIGLDPD